MTMRFAGVEPPRAARAEAPGEGRARAGNAHEDAGIVASVHRQARSGIYGAMECSVPRRLSLFPDDPIAELRGLGSLTDPDDDAAAVIDLAVIGARGDGKTQFIVHAIRALHAHAPALEGAEQRLNQDVMRLVLDPRATRPDATPPGVVPHFTFRVRAAGLLDRLRGTSAVRLAWRAGRVGFAIVLAIALAVAGAVVAARGDAAAGVVVGASGALVGAIAALMSRRRISGLGDVEVVFWDIAGEQVYSAAAADYYTLLGRLVDARRRRAEARGRAYAFVPVLICNPLALGTDDEGSPYERLRELLPLFAALDRDAARALIAINRWSVVDPICARGALRDEVVSVTSCARGEEPSTPRVVAREQVRAHCLDAEDGRDKGVRVTYLRYDTAIRAGVDVDGEEGGARVRVRRRAGGVQRRRAASLPRLDRGAGAVAARPGRGGGGAGAGGRGDGGGRARDGQHRAGAGVGRDADPGGRAGGARIALCGAGRRLVAAARCAGAAMTIAIRHAWLQKHPSPAATRGEFHWYPPDDDRELRASFVERSRGVDAPAVLWQLAAGARELGADVRRDRADRWPPLRRDGAHHRRGGVGDAGGAARGARGARGGAVERAGGGAAAAAAAGAAGRATAEIAAIARALLAGGDAALAEPDGAGLPALIASVERWMPASVARRTRAGAWRMGAASPAPDRVAGLIAAAWADPASRAAQAWTLLCELAAAKERSVDEVAGELGAADQPAAALTEGERAALGEARDFAATLHAWGRGRLDASASAGTLPSRLADAIAVRVLACLVAGRDPRAPIAEARWHALLPASRRSALLDAVVRRAGSLRTLVEVHDG